MKDLRLLPILLFALVGLLFVKGMDLLDRGGVKMQGAAPAQAEEAAPATQPVVEAEKPFGRVLTDVRASRLPLPEEKKAPTGTTLVDKRFAVDPLITGSAGGGEKKESTPAEGPKSPSTLGQKPISLEEQRKALAEKAAAEAGVLPLPPAGEGDPAAAGEAHGGDVQGADAAAAASGEAPAAEQAAGDAVPAGEAGAPPATETTQAEPAQPPLELDAPLNDGAASESERALLERLQQRRQQLDEQGRELDLRENLLQAAEKRIEDRITELKTMESSVGAAQAKKEEEDKARLKGLIDMYSSMKPKDAARIFDSLSTDLLVDIAAAMKPATMGSIIAAMSPDAASRLTVALAGRRDPAKPVADAAPALDLPKIEGKPAASAN
jgi:flagellar motility protein MotE (MotC chaperone)